MTAAVAPVYQMWQSGSFWKKWGITKNPYDGWIPLRLWGQGGISCQGEPHPQALEKGTKPSLAGQHSSTCHSSAESNREAFDFVLCLTSFRESPSSQHSSKIKEFSSAARCQRVKCSGLNRSLFSAAFWSVHPWLTFALGWYLAEAEHRAGVRIIWSIYGPLRIDVFTELIVQHIYV